MNKTVIANFLDNSKLNKFHKSLLIIGIFVITFSGYGLSVIGTIVPIITEEWQINATQAGFISSAGMFGMMFGAIGLSFLADRYGAKKILILSILIFSVCILGATIFNNPLAFAAFRFLAGVGSGGATPIIISLLTEYSPKANKSKMVAIALCGNQIGGMLSPFIGMLVIERFGWRPVLWIAVLPLLLLPYIYKSIPESAQFLAKKQQYDELGTILGKIDETYQEKIDLKQSLSYIGHVTPKKVEKVSYSRLFTKRYFLSTILIGLIYIMGLLAINGVNTWLPNVMVKSGFDLGPSLAFSIFLNAGTMIGTISWAGVADKKGFTVLLPVIYTIGGICLMLMGVKVNIIVLYIFITLIGGFLFAAHSLVNAFVSQFYPDDIRTTGVGFANSIGRVGGMLGPIVGGMLLTANASTSTWFITFGAPGIIAAIAVIIINTQQRYFERKDAEAPLVNSEN